MKWSGTINASRNVRDVKNLNEDNLPKKLGLLIF